jgi:hypothetical protein
MHITFVYGPSGNDAKLTHFETRGGVVRGTLYKRVHFVGREALAPVQKTTLKLLEVRGSVQLY